MGLADISKVCSHNMPRTTERTFAADGPRSSRTRLFLVSPLFPLHLLLLIPFFAMGLGQFPGCTFCGGFVGVFSTETVIKTPEMTGSTSCVWVLEAPKKHVLNFTVNFISRRFANKHCQWFQIRSDNAFGHVMLNSFCSSGMWNGLITPNRWAYMWFHTDSKSPKGTLSVTVSAIHKAEMQDARDPTKCMLYQYRCPNKLCLSFSDRCDGHADCGCPGGLDDEQGCFDTHGYDAFFIATVGISIGVALIIIVVVAGLFLERRHDWDLIAARAEAYRSKSLQHDPQTSTAPVAAARHISTTAPHKAVPLSSALSTRALNKVRQSAN